MESLTINDIDKLRPYLKKADYREYNSNVVTMMMWQFSYPITYEIHDAFALVRWHHKDGCSWMMPLCEKVHWKEAMEYMLAYSRRHGEVFSVISATEEFVSWCSKEYPHVFLYEDLVNAQDYIYVSEQHRTLSGKKMQKRRNHYNAFVKEYEGRYLYKELHEIHNEEILDYLHVWNEHHEASHSLESEKRGIRFLLQHRDVLRLMGGGIYIDGELKAFLIASELSADMLEIHVEKADKEIRGLYIAMLKHFLMHQDPAYTYINREDDMGLAYLRTAKMNMHPAYKVKKYGIYERHLHIRKARCEDVGQLHALWLNSFAEETPKTTDYFFQHLFREDDCYVIVYEEEILSMLQCREIVMQANETDERVSFIVGVATKETYRRNGLMRELLQHVLEMLRKKEPFTVLQAYDWDLYKPFGFQISHVRQKAHPHLYSEMTGITVKECYDPEVLLDVYRTFCKTKNGYRLRDREYYETYLIPYVSMDGGKIYVAYEKEEPVGSMIVYDALCSEYLPLNETANMQMQYVLYIMNPHMEIWADTNVHLEEKSDIVPCLMTLYHDNRRLDGSLFFSEVL